MHHLDRVALSKGSGGKCARHLGSGPADRLYPLGGLSAWPAWAWPQNLSTEQDRVSKNVFAKLSSLLTDRSVEKVREIATKRVAHAADTSSRANVKHGIRGLTIGELGAAHRNLITVAEFISGSLLSETTVGA